MPRRSAYRAARLPPTWWLIDATEKRRLADELATERRRTAFLAEASSRLLASLNLERCMEVTVRPAARYRATRPW